ncbi:MAG TPA: ATP-binding protein [Acidobacteriaceae bacterium]|nr:ATP-binding protein [Acidobacteriaceae bacterium]
MGLRTKLVLTAGGLTFAIVLVLSTVFLGQLLHQRIDNTYASNDILARTVQSAAIEAVRSGLQTHPPDPNAPDPIAAFHAAVAGALRSNSELLNTMHTINRSSLDVQDVSVTDANGLTLVSTDPDAVNQYAPRRASFASMLQGSIIGQVRELFGRPHVLDISEDIQRNKLPFLVVHIGVSTHFLNYAYKPWLSAALEFALLATIASAVVAALLSAVALRPLQAINQQLERLTLTRGEPSGSVVLEQPLMLDAPAGGGDPLGRVTRSIDRLGRELRSREEGYTALQTNLNQMLDTLRDGVVLFAPEGRAVMVSDAVAYFLNRPGGPPPDEMVGMAIEQIFLPGTALGDAVLAAFHGGIHISAETVVLEDGRQVQISLDRIGDSSSEGTVTGASERGLGTLLTLRDTGSARELEQELEVSRRLAAIGRLTANVGHEVKNPINAMVVHLELLRGKLAAGSFDAPSAQKHVEILSDEMRRLDRVVETLADFSRPMDLDLRDHDLRRVVEQTIELAGEELKEHGVAVESNAPPAPVPVRVDAELVRQALLNLILNAMQAMPEGGLVRTTVRRDQRLALVEIADNGVGIPESLLPRIFDLYFTTKARGSGIGLAMTYRILQLHGGSLEVRSNADPGSPARGTTFTLLIPLSVSSVDPRKPAQLGQDLGGNGATAAVAAASDPSGPSVTTKMNGKEIA